MRRGGVVIPYLTLVIGVALDITKFRSGGTLVSSLLVLIILYILYTLEMKAWEQPDAPRATHRG